ncbi:MAG: cellulose biosynthesis cyclic di-GMP-binding regulatory protein BcsB [Anaerolineae bacterium]|nr:cellulose biosynthesis cyclic di-GMP-binding regulatory protein BcsB [Anaerolineae bacterium]
MKRSLVFKLFGFILLAGLVFSLAGVRPVLAQTTSQADLTLTNLGMAIPQTLTGPISEVNFTFNLPADWKPEGTATLDLDITAFFSSLVATESSQTLSGLVGGDLSVFLNDSMVGINTLQTSGQQILHYEFDAALFAPVTRDGVNILRIRWDGSISCLMNLLSSVTISPASKLTFGYNAIQKTLTLNDFPAPFVVKNSVQPVPLKIALSAKPSAGELRAAMILAAGIGQISNGQTVAEVISQADYRPTASTSQNVILVANNDTMKTLPLSTLGIASGLQANAGEGLVYFFKPLGGYGLLVSGDETGIVKAAQAVSADQVIAGGDASTMLVSGINPVAATTGPEDMTLDNLGVGELVFTRPNALSQSFDFFVPAGNQVRADASFDLVLSHSQQLDYLRSGLQMLVNGYPAVSLRLTDNTSNQALFKLIMPANLVHAGRNTVEFLAVLNTRDLCTAATENVAWLRVSSSSLLHLPLETAVGGSMVSKSFGDFPNAFLTGSGLDNVLIEVAPAEFGNIQAAAQLAGRLGAGLPDHTIMQLKTAFSDIVDPVLAANASLILVGEPLKFTSLTDKSQFPSLVFDNKNLLSDQSALELVTRPQASEDAGYLAIRGYDAITSKVLLAVLGSSPAGLTYAVDGLTSKQAAKNNFLIVTGKNEETGWLDAGIATGEIVTPSSLQTPVTPGVDAVQTFRISMLKWVVPAMVVLLAVMLLFLYIEIRLRLNKKQ